MSEVLWTFWTLMFLATDLSVINQTAPASLSPEMVYCAPQYSRHLF